jgi:hypothetical protein
MTICPNIKGQSLTVTFKKFDLADGDTLFVYEGTDTTGTLITKASGNGVSKMNGGWVTSNCNPSINPSSCLTFLFKTNGDNLKGIGWEANATCVVGEITRFKQPANVFGTTKCDSLKTPVNLRIPTISRGTSDCSQGTDSVIVSYCGTRDTFQAGILSFPVFPFGSYPVTYKLLADTNITTSNMVHVSAPALACNDTVTTTIGQGCITMIRPDDILEGPCDTGINYVNTHYKVRVYSDKGILEGTAPNFPILDASKEGNVTCNRFYRVTVFRTLTVNYQGCMQVQIDSCSAMIQLIDGIKPVFISLNPDTILGCQDMELAQTTFKKPNVIDNCEIDTIIATLPSNTMKMCDAYTTVDVIWTAYDLCGNSSSAAQKVVISRPNHFTLPKDTTLTQHGNTSPDSLGWPLVDINGSGVGAQVLTGANSFCNFNLIYEDDTLKGICGENFNIYRTFKIFDECTASASPVFEGVQSIFFRDTIAPLAACPKSGELGSQTKPYVFSTSYNSCKGPIGNIPLLSSEADPSNPVVVLGVYRLSDNQLVAGSINGGQILEIGAYRVAYRLKDVCGNSSNICNIYFNISDLGKPIVVCSDELIVSLAYGSIRITPEDIGRGTYDACGIDTMLIRRTICGNDSIYPLDTNHYVANKLATFEDANGWGSYIEIGCCDVRASIKVQLLVFDIHGNYNKCWLTITPEHQPQTVCRDLPDAREYCDIYETTYIGVSTDKNNNNAFDDNEWQVVDSNLIKVLNTQFGSPACNTNITCTDSHIDQEYQLIRQSCGMQMMRRRFRTRSMDPQNIHPWYHQNIRVDYRPGWSFTFPPDTVLQCGTTSAGSIPEMELQINGGTCDQLGWEVKDEVFEAEDGACFKILRKWLVINNCQSDDVQQAFELPRDQVDGKVVPSSKRTFSSSETINGTKLSEKGYFSYTQLIVMMDNQAPIISIADVETCIIGVADAAPFNQADTTLGAPPYECDTIKRFSATGMDCTASNLLDFSYEVFENGGRIASGKGSSFDQVVTSNRTYRVRFTASDNCGNLSSAERSYTFRDCRKPTVFCQTLRKSVDATRTLSVNVKDLNAHSFDNCTDTTNLRFRMWHPIMGIPVPTNLTGILALPPTITLNCNNFGLTQANFYVIDEAGNYDFCVADIVVEDNLNYCGFARPSIFGSIQTTTGEMVEKVEVLVSGSGEMPEIMMTDASGYYKYEVNKGEDYTIRPKKDEAPMNGVSTYDLVLIQQHILGLKKFDSPYKYIAADINNSKSISAYDLVILRQMILNTISEFPNNESWKFVSMEDVMESPNPLLKGYKEQYAVKAIENNVEIDFMAVKIGDVNDNALANSFMQGEERNSNKSLVFKVKDQKIETGKTYQIDFNIDDIKTLLAYQFTLEFDGLAFEEVLDGLVDENHFGMHLSERGMLTTSWNKIKNTRLEANKALFSLEFTAEKAGLLSEMLRFTSAITNAEAYNTEKEILEIELIFEKGNSKSFELYQNYPNPFREQTQIKFYLPEASDVTLTVMDISGKIIKSTQSIYEMGLQTITLNREDLPTSGVVYYELKSSAGKLTKSMLILN